MATDVGLFHEMSIQVLEQASDNAEITLLGYLSQCFFSLQRELTASVSTRCELFYL